MNRWRSWAERLRARHTRREGQRTPGSLVLARGARFTSRTVHSGVRHILHVCPRVSITLRAVAPPTLGTRSILVVRPESGAGPRTILRRSESTRSWRLLAPPVQTPNASSSLTFVDPRRLRADVTTVERRVERLHDTIDRWRWKPLAAIEAAALPGRVRRRGAREEAMAPDQARTLPVLQHRRTGITPASPVPAAAPAEPWRERSERVAAVPAPAPVDVDAITNQVIHQLDRRLIAYRERMGRS